MRGALQRPFRRADRTRLASTGRRVSFFDGAGPDPTAWWFGLREAQLWWVPFHGQRL